jgi:hypothetical protein
MYQAEQSEQPKLIRQIDADLAHMIDAVRYASKEPLDHGRVIASLEAIRLRIKQGTKPRGTKPKRENEGHKT